MSPTPPTATRRGAEKFNLRVVVRKNGRANEFRSNSQKATWRASAGSREGRGSGGGHTRDSTGCSATRTQTRMSTRDSPPWTNSSRRARRTAASGTRTTPSERRVATRASGRACALSRGGDRAVGHVVHSQTLLRHCATSAGALRNEPSETRARPLQARASPAAPIDGTLEGTTLVLVKIVSSSVKIDVVSAELHFGTHYGTVLPGPAS